MDDVAASQMRVLQVTYRYDSQAVLRHVDGANLRSSQPTLIRTSCADLAGTPPPALHIICDASRLLTGKDEGQYLLQRQECSAVCHASSVCMQM